MKAHTPDLPNGSMEIMLAWTAAWVNVTLASVALLPSVPLRALAVTLGATAYLSLMDAFRRRATPFLAAILTVGAAAFATATVVGLSGLPWETGISWSQAGGTGRPMAWLFTTTSLCVGAGVLATGRLMVQAGQRRGALTGRGRAAAAVLPALSFAGFTVLALCPVGGSPVLAASHNIASWAAFGSFWFGMVAAVWLRDLSVPLRAYSAIAAVAVFATWLPNGLRFMRLTEARPISMLTMELVVFPACLIWFCWLAWEWSTPTRRE